MKKKIFLIFFVTATIIAVLWFSGIIPKQIAKISGTKYVKEHFPKMQLEYMGIEWAGPMGNYNISFKDKSGKVYGCLIGPKYFPVSVGQGITIIENEYAEHYK